MSKLRKVPKFLEKILTDRVELIIQICFDYDLYQKNLFLDPNSTEYKKLYEKYLLMVRDELKKVGG